MILFLIFLPYTTMLQKLTLYLPPFRYVLSLPSGGSKWKTNDPWAAHRLFGGVCRPRRDINVNAAPNFTLSFVHL